jgi:PilZ domain
MQQERRKSERVRVHLDTEWKRDQARHEGSIVDISLHGCFIAAAEEVMAGDFIEVEIRVPSVMRMDLRGIVAHKMRGRGFAIRFKDLTGTEQGLLRMLLKMMKQRAPSPTA